MRMMIEVLTPGMEHGGEADLGSEMFGIGGDRRERSRGGLEQKSIDRRLVLIGDCADFGGQREYDVEIGRGQQVRLSRRPPTNLDRRHDAALGEAYMAGIGRAPRLTVATEDVRHLQLRF